MQNETGFGPADLEALYNYSKREAQKTNVTEEYRQKMYSVAAAANYLLANNANVLYVWWKRK